MLIFHRSLQKVFTKQFLGIICILISSDLTIVFPHCRGAEYNSVSEPYCFTSILILSPLFLLQSPSSLILSPSSDIILKEKLLCFPNVKYSFDSEEQIILTSLQRFLQLFSPSPPYRGMRLSPYSAWFLPGYFH